MPPPTTKRGTTTNLKTKKQQELPENRAVWKSNNQGVKEETFIQTGRRGGDRQRGGEDTRQGSSWRTGVSEVVTGRAGSPPFVCR